MLHDEAVLALAFSQDSDMLASGSQDGKLKGLAREHGYVSEKV